MRCAVWLVCVACYTGGPYAPPAPQRPPPPPADPGARVGAPPARVAAGAFHTCAIDDDHRVWCWGHGIKGQTGPNGDHLRPVATGIDDASQIAAGDWFTCVLRRGAVACFGDNDAGQLRGPGAGIAVELDAGDRFACARMRDSSVRCWGQLEGSPPDSGAVQLAVGASHACALHADASISCWGQDHLGQTGGGRVMLPGVVGIAAGGVNTCAWTSEGSVYCWGDRAFGALGSQGTGTNHLAQPEPVRVAGVRDVRAVDVGPGRACAIDHAGAVTCWGSNYMGALGLDRGGEVPPTRLSRLDRPIAEISVGGRHTCARATDDTVACWGANYWGELGAGGLGARWWPEPVALTDEPPAAPMARPTPVISTTLPSGAIRVQTTLDSEATLGAAGWTRLAGGQSTFVNGKLRLRAHGYEEWKLTTNDFVANAGNPPGWAVEARFKLDKPCAKPGTGLWIHDGLHFVKVLVADGQLVLRPGPTQAIGRTDTFRTYRVELASDTLTVRVDGTQVLTTTAIPGQASQVLMFGALGDGCGADESTWENVAY